MVVTNSIKSIIKNNVYVKKYRTKKGRNIHSMSYLVDGAITQSDCIKLGIAMESVTRDIIKHHSNLDDIKQTNKKGVREKDHLFIDHAKKIVYYAEMKTNLCLDTEKCKSTEQKCKDIKLELEKIHDGYTVKSHLVGLRYPNHIDIPRIIQKKYENPIHSINEYFESLGVNVNFSNLDYSYFVNYVVESMLRT